MGNIIRYKGTEMPDPLLTRSFRLPGTSIDPTSTNATWRRKDNNIQSIASDGNYYDINQEYTEFDPWFSGKIVKKNDTYYQCDNSGKWTEMSSVADTSHHGPVEGQGTPTTQAILEAPNFLKVSWNVRDYIDTAPYSYETTSTTTGLNGTIANGGYSGSEHTLPVFLVEVKEGSFFNNKLFWYKMEGYIDSYKGMYRNTKYLIGVWYHTCLYYVTPTGSDAYVNTNMNLLINKQIPSYVNNDGQSRTYETYNRYNGGSELPSTTFTFRNTQTCVIMMSNPFNFNSTGTDGTFIFKLFTMDNAYFVIGSGSRYRDSQNGRLSECGPNNKDVWRIQFDYDGGTHQSKIYVGTNYERGACVPYGNDRDTLGSQADIIAVQITTASIEVYMFNNDYGNAYDSMPSNYDTHSIASTSGSTTWTHIATFPASYPSYYDVFGLPIQHNTNFYWMAYSESILTEESMTEVVKYEESVVAGTYDASEGVIDSGSRPLMSFVGSDASTLGNATLVFPNVADLTWRLDNRAYPIGTHVVCNETAMGYEVIEDPDNPSQVKLKHTGTLS